MPERSAEARRRDVLATIKTPGPEAAKRLIGWLSDEDPLVREWAVEGVTHQKDRADAVDALLERVRDERADLRCYAIRSIGKLGVRKPEVTEALRASLGD